MGERSIEILGSVFFALAVLHTFLAAQVRRFSHRFAKGSGWESFFHLLGEIEIVFGLWGALLLCLMALLHSPAKAISYQQSLQFTEAIFVFCIMVMASTKPILELAKGMIQSLGNFLNRIFAVPEVLADVFVVLTIGPLMGSLMTEPAAMTVTALLLNAMVKRNESRILYVLLGVLFVNVSIGGALTPFAAPPILMVAKTWNWDFSFILSHFGWKSFLAVVLNALFVILYFSKGLKLNLQALSRIEKPVQKIPFAVTLLHLLFLVFLILSAHYSSIAMGIFLLFLGLVSVTGKYQERLRIRESLLVAFFLAGIVFFGPLQKWWLAPLLSQLDQYALYFGACALTAVTDNAALTYLGSQVQGLSAGSQYYLVAGALAGGGLTIIANAPNAAGFSVLQNRFEDGLNPLKLFVAALIPTLIAILALGFLPDISY